jgi:hypothetical protein
MSLPYERPNLEVVVTDESLLYELPGPSRTYLQKLLVVRDEGNESVSEPGNDSFSVEAFNRAFIGPVCNILAIEQSRTGNRCVLVLDANPKVRVGDPLDIDGNSETANDGMHRVTAIETSASGWRITTNRVYATGTGGTAQLNITGQYEELYRVLAPQASVDNVVIFNPDSGVLFENQDPRRHDGSSHERKIYLRFSLTGTYRVTLGFCGVEQQGF